MFADIEFKFKLLGQMGKNRRRWTNYVGTKDQFLTKSTAEGFRVTILSTIELSQYLLSCGFHYVLSNKFNQDSLEVL
jgi:hypothetical protein